MDVARTPDDRFADLPGYRYPPCYAEVGSKSTGALRMHYVEAGPPDADPVLLLHGQPTWSYLYRTVIDRLAAAGHWVLAPDLIGFGRSDKPTDRFTYTFRRHVDWMERFVAALDLHRITVVVQDWAAPSGWPCSPGDPTGSPGWWRRTPSCTPRNRPWPTASAGPTTGWVTAG